MDGVDLFVRAFPDAEGVIIDMGCGTGRAAALLNKLEGMSVILIDHARNCLDDDVKTELDHRFQKACLWKLPSYIDPAEYIFCCDVMEHIPEERVDMVLRNIAARCLIGGIFKISTVKDSMGQAIVGEPLHLTIKPAKWWVEKISQFFTIREKEISDKEVSFVVDVINQNS